MNTINIVNKIEQIATSMGFIRIELVKTEVINTNILWSQFLLYDNEALPIRLDILNDIYAVSTKTIYSSPGTGINTESNFITPKDNNLAVFLVNKGYIFVGITPREDAAPPIPNFGLFKNWGLEKHTNDFKKIITFFQSIIDQDYEVLGHSAGALVALNYASANSQEEFKTVRVIDIVGQYPINSQEFINSQTSLSATTDLINRGIFTDTDVLGFKLITQQAQTNPTGDSGFPRPVGGGNFTNEGLLFFSLIFTNQLPGTITGATGLPGSWYFRQGFFQGTYDFGPTPIEDTYSLTHTKIETVYSVIGGINSGIYPIAYDRDFFALLSNSYPLAFDAIKLPVYYINTELGFGDASYTISLFTSTNVIYDVVKDYGHADATYSDTAETDFWVKLVP